MNLQLSDFLFTGFNKRVAALHRDTGEILWDWEAPHGNGYVSLLLDGECFIASISGYLYALDAFSGALLWANEMKGFGYGVASLVSVRGGASPHFLAAASAAQAAATTAASGTAAGILFLVLACAACFILV